MNTELTEYESWVKDEIGHSGNYITDDVILDLAKATHEKWCLYIRELISLGMLIYDGSIEYYFTSVSAKDKLFLLPITRCRIHSGMKVLVLPRETAEHYKKVSSLKWGELEEYQRFTSKKVVINALENFVDFRYKEAA